MQAETRRPSQALAHFVDAWHWRDVPADVRHEARRSLVNYFAVALSAAREPTMNRAVAVYSRFSAGRTASLTGRVERMDMLNAAALNAMSANVFDFDDTHIPTIIHPSAPVAAALFALAESTDAPISGATLLHAFALGVEVECRIGSAVSPEHYQRGWHITSTCGVFGAAAAVAKVLGLSQARIVWAFGHAAAQAGGLVETLGTMAKSVSVGNAARNGLLSALLAQADCNGPDAPLEGERGYLRVSASHFDERVLIGDLGETWALRSNTYKPYPCGVVLNPVIDACLALRRDASWTLADIEHVELTGHPLLRERTDRPRVRTGRASQVSAQHAVAVVLARGEAGLPEFSDEAVADGALGALANRLRFIDAPTYAVESAQVAIVLRSGERISHRVEAARGSLAAPLSDADLNDKLTRLAEFGGSGVETQALANALWHLDSEADAATPMRLSAKRFSQS